jgi:hypothetical protein
VNGHHTALDDLLGQLGRDAGLGDFALDSQGQARLIFDGRIAVDLEWDAANAVLHVYSTLDDAQALVTSADREILLKANFLTERTAGATFGIDPRMGDVVLSWQWHPEGGNYALFRDRLSRFIDTIEQVPALIEAFDHPRGARPHLPFGTRTGDSVA